MIVFEDWHVLTEPLLDWLSRDDDFKTKLKFEFCKFFATIIEKRVSGSVRARAREARLMIFLSSNLSRPFILKFSRSK